MFIAGLAATSGLLSFCAQEDQCESTRATAGTILSYIAFMRMDSWHNGVQATLQILEGLPPGTPVEEVRAHLEQNYAQACSHEACGGLFRTFLKQEMSTKLASVEGLKPLRKAVAKMAAVFLQGEVIRTLATRPGEQPEQAEEKTDEVP